MLDAAMAGHTQFDLCEVERERPGPHYLIDTMQILRGQYPTAELYLLMGEDSLRDLPGWHEPEALIAAAPLLTMRRFSTPVDMSALERTLPGITARTTFLDAPGMDLSSTIIRARIHRGQTCRYLTPDSVLRIIQEAALYR